MNKKTIHYNSVLPQLNDSTLYAQGEPSVLKALEVAKTLTDTSYNKRTNFFVYWVGANLNEKHETAIKSFLTTQDLSICTLMIYSDVDLSNNPIIKKITDVVKDGVETHVFDVITEVKGTPLEDCPWNMEIRDHRWNAALESDYFRLLMLWKYGGVYSDFDILFLRDLRPLLDYEWVYQWGSEQDRMNGAIIRLKARSAISEKHLEILKKTAPVRGSLVWADDLYQGVRETHDDLVVFPGAWFNTEWQIPWDSNKFFRMCAESARLFPGAFCWHFHNKWNQPIEFASKMNILMTRIEQQYKKKFKL